MCSSYEIHNAKLFALSEIKRSCWVPNCSNIENTNYFKTFYPLPADANLRELWLARAGKPVDCHIENIHFCEEHFMHNDLVNYELKGTILVPGRKMSQVICRLCMSIISDTRYHVLSKTIPTDIPLELKDILKPAKVITPEPFQNIVKFCLPELKIQAEPIPLICQSCFKRIWKFLFKTTCIEVDQKLRGDPSITTCGKVVLCRACPQTFSTNFIVLVEKSNLGMFLMNMFSNRYPSNMVPLRLCKNCYEILEELLEFQLNCYAVEEKIKCHIVLTENQAVIRASVISSLGNNSIWETKSTHSKEKPQILDISDDSIVSINSSSFVMWKRVEFIKAMIKHGLALRYKVDKNQKDEIWRRVNQELQMKGVACNTLGLKSVWLTMIAEIQRAINKKQNLNESQLLLIQYLKTDNQAVPASRNLDNNNTNESVNLGCSKNIQLDSKLCQLTQLPSIFPEKCLDGVNICESAMHCNPKINFRILQESTTSAKNINNETSANFCHDFQKLPNNEIVVNHYIERVGNNNGNIFPTTKSARSENSSLDTSVSAKSRKANKLCNALELDVNKKQKITHDMNMPTIALCDCLDNTVNSVENHAKIEFSNDEQLELLEIMKIEYKLYLEDVGKVYTKPPFKDILARIIKGHNKYRDYPLVTIHNCWKTMEKSCMQYKNDETKTILHEKILEFLEFEKQHRRIKVHSKLLRKSNKGSKLQKRRKSLVPYQDKIDLVDAIQQEYNSLMDEEKKVRSVWKMLVHKIHRTGFKNWSLKKTYTLWSRLKVSAIVHEKNAGDLVDEKLWKLLEKYNKDKNCLQNTKRIIKNNEDKNNNGDINRRNSSHNSDRNLSNGLELDENVSDMVNSLNGEKDTDTTKIERGQNAYNFASKGPLTMDNGSEYLKEKKQHQNTNILKYQKFSEAEKLCLFKNIKEEYLAMLKNNDQKMSRPWRTIIHRVQAKYYKNIFSVNKVLSEWTKMRKSAALHENSNAMSTIDWKVIRLMKLVNKMKECKYVRNENKFHAVSRGKTVQDNEVQKSKAEEKLDEKKNEDVIWCYKTRLDLIETITKYGKDVFSECPGKENDVLWLKIKKNFHEKGYTYSDESLRKQWEKLQESANMAWRDENTATELDKMIIEFMKSVIPIKQVNNDMSKDEEDLMTELPILDTEENNQVTTNSEDQNSSDDDNAILEEMNDEYVSIDDIRCLIPNVLNSDVVELSSDDETVIDFKIKSDVTNVIVIESDDE